MSDFSNQSSAGELKRVLNALPEALCAFRQGESRPFFVNSSWLRKMEASSVNELCARCSGNIVNCLHPDDRARAAEYLSAPIEDGGSRNMDCRVVTSKGNVLRVRMNFRNMADPKAGAVRLCSFLEIGDALLKAPSEETDPLTGLPSLHAFIQAMEERRKEGRGSLAVLFIDIVNFRLLNLHKGVSSGDMFLKSFGQRLKRLFPDGMVSHFDADHFAVLAPAEGIDERAGEVRDIARGFSSSIDATVGKCAWDSDLTSAELACSRAKMASDECRRHDNTFFLSFTPQMGRRLEISEYVATSIDTAINRGWIKVYYQPIIRSLTGQLCSFEALARWDDPARGLLPPAQFIAPLEEAQQIWKLDLCVIRQAVSQMASRERHGLPEIPISVNLSRMDFLHCDIFKEIEDLLRRHDVPRRMLHIEITESVMTSREEVVRSAIDSFISAGYELWMDDFGSGYSTLNQLKDSKFDLLKLDMAFLRSDTPRSRAIISSIIAMDKRIGIRTLAEGVETPEQAEFLRNSGCEKLQGYLFGKPLPFEESLASCLRSGIALENPKRKSYYDALSQVDFLKGIPVLITELREGRIRVLFMNGDARRELKEIGVEGCDGAEALANAQGTALNRDLLKAAELAIRTGRIENVLCKINGRSRVFRFHVLSRCGGDSLFETNLYDSSRVEQEFQGSLASLVHLRCFYSGLYDIDLSAGTVRSCLYADDTEASPSSPLIGGDGKASEILPEILPADRKRYLVFLDPRTLAQRLAGDRNGLVRGIFRTRDEDGSFRWMSHRIVRVPSGPHSSAIYGVRPLDVGTDRDEADLLSSHAFGQRTRALDDKDLLWENLMLGSPLPLFWKDSKRRFLGASRRFLDYYGFSSQGDIIGKTDEDMRWHPGNGPYRNDEEDVLRTGEIHESVPGKCIAHGITHSILATKWPVFRNGKVDGLMGYFLDEEMVRGLTAGASAVASKLDAETGLPTVESFFDDLAHYETDNRLDGRKFGIIMVQISQFKRILASFGTEAMRAAVRACADVVRREAGPSASCSRVGTGQFAVISQCSDRRDLEAVAQRIRSGIGAIHRVGGADCSLFARASVVPPGQSEKFRSLLLASVAEHAAESSSGLSGFSMNNRLVRSLMDDIPIGCYIVRPDCTVTYWNREATKLLGYGPEEMVGRKCTELPLGCAATNSSPIPLEKCPAMLALSTGSPQTIEMFMTAKDGSDVLIRSTLVPISDGSGGTDVAALFTPLSDSRYNRSLVRAIYEVATRDRLTGLPGRKYMEVCIDEALENYRRTGHSFAVVLADIDHFHDFNEKLGREAGDAVLSQVGSLLRHNGRKSDIFCRWGGDEIVALLQIRSPGSARLAAERFLKIAGGGKATFKGHTIRFCCSVGIALPGREDTVVSIIDRADRLMFKAREAKGGERIEADPSV